MSENIYSIDINNPMHSTSQKGSDFYKEQINEFKKNGKSTKAVEVINVFLFNGEGQLIVQKRASNKNHNPNLLDKSIGGHITFGDTPNYTTMLETVQELQVPSMVLNDNKDFEKTYNILKDYLNTIAIIKFLSVEILYLGKNIDGEKINIGNKIYLYIGIYDGPIKNVDKEAKGIMFYDLDELAQEIIDMPSLFTEDLKFFINKYNNEFKNFIKGLELIKNK